MRNALPALLATLLALPAAGQFDYAVTLDPAEGVWRVEGRFENPGGEDVELWIARWTPGAYHLADYGRFAGPLEATDADGGALAVERLDDSHWSIAADGATTIVVAYEGQSISQGPFTEGVLDVESNRIRADYAYLTPVSLIGFVPGRLDEPFTLRVDAPEGWRVGTVLEQDDSGAYLAPSYYRLEDSPLLLSPDLTTVEVEAGGKPLLVSVFGKGGDELAELVDGCRRIAEAGAELMGGVPYERYHFLIGFTPEAQGAGLEHSDSTLILMHPGVDAGTTWGIVAHEYFHLWCAERIHVEEIRDPDYTRPLETGTIWVNESLTEYFTQHVLLHAGLLEVDDLLTHFAGPNGMLEAILQSPMVEQLGAPTAVSRSARSWESMNDLGLFALKMYMLGPRTMFALDMEMRRATGGERGVHDLLLHLMREYAERGRGFPEDGMLAILGAVTGGADLSDFYESYIDGADHPDPADYLDVIGFELGADGVQPVDDPSPAQVEALQDYLSVTG